MYEQLVKHLEGVLSQAQKKGSIDSRLALFLTKQKESLTSVDFEDALLQNPQQKLNAWRELSKAAFLSKMCRISKSLTTTLKTRWQELENTRSACSSLLEDSYSHLCAHLFTQNLNAPLSIKLFDDGYCPMQDHPALFFKRGFLQDHAELGVVLLFLGHLKNNESYTNFGLNIASWHFQKLSESFLPYRGFMTNYKYSSYHNLVLKHALLFFFASVVKKDPYFAYVSKIQLQFLLSTPSHLLKKTSLFDLTSWRFIKLCFKDEPTPARPPQSSNLKDSKWPQITYKNASIDCAVSYLGQNMSMGSLKFGGLEVAGFGPQMAHLGDGETFGFIDKLGDDTFFNYHMSDKGFSLKGTVGLPNSEKNVNDDSYWQTPKSWIETKATGDEKSLCLKIKPLNLKREIFFVFYVIADQCLIGNEKKILYPSLEKYEGEACFVSFLNKNKIITLETSEKNIPMQIIPLQGGESFWGANYLIAYKLKKTIYSFDWILNCSNR